MTLGGGGGSDSHFKVIQELWVSPGDGDLLMIHEVGDIGSGLKVAGGGWEFVKGEGRLEEDDKNHQQGGGGVVGVHIFL